MNTSNVREIREKFRTEALGHLREAGVLLRSITGPDIPERLQKASRHMHALKGTAPLVGARPVSEVARTVEHCVKQAINDPAALTSGLLESLQKAIQVMTRQVEEFTAEQTIEDGAAVIQSLRSLIPSTRSVDEILTRLQTTAPELRRSLGDTQVSILGRDLDEGRHFYIVEVLPSDQMQYEVTRIRSALKDLATIASVASRAEGSVSILISSIHESGYLKARLMGPVVTLTDLHADAPTQAHPDAEPAITAPATRPAGKPFRVLFSDDSQISRDIYRILLQRNGYDVEVASDGQEAFRMLQQGDIDAVITDDQMTEMDGIVFLQLARKEQRFRGIPFIVISGHTSEEAKTRALKSGATAYLVKGDFEKAQLLEILRTALEKGTQ